jgi:hypothetical protein
MDVPGFFASPRSTVYQDAEDALSLG